MIQVCGGNIATVRAHIPSNTFKLNRTTIAATVLSARLLLTRTVLPQLSSVCAETSTPPFEWLVAVLLMHYRAT